METPVNTNDQVVFQFLLGIQGSGHHLHKGLFRISNLNERLHYDDLNNDKFNLKKQKANLNFRLHYDGLHDDMFNLGKMFWNDEETHKGLWSAFHQSEIPPKGKEMINEIADQLRAVSDKVLRNRSERKIDGMNSTDKILVIPINASFDMEFSYYMHVGMFKLLQYPDLNDLYKACQIAGVACRHIVLSRDPFEIMRSISIHREFGNPHEEMLGAISMLSVIESQIMSNPKYLAACWNLDTGISDQGAKFIAQYLGWNDDEYEEHFSSMYSKTPLTEKDMELITDSGNLDIYMESFIAATDRMNRKCMDILEAKQDGNFDDSENSDDLSIIDQQVREKSNAATLFSGNVDKPSTLSPPKKTGLPVTFNFIMGAEGAGHQLHEVLFDGSPLQKALNSYELTKDIKDIILLLYNPNDLSKGIWSAPCANYSNHVDDGPKGNLLFNSLTRHLREVARKVGGKVFDNIEELVIPINALFHFDLSYPSNSLSNSSDFPMLQYPNLDILYKACEEAGVVCQHVFLSRDPYEILKSLQEKTVEQQREGNMLVEVDIHMELIRKRRGKRAGHTIAKKPVSNATHFQLATHIQLKKTLTTLSIIETQLESNPHNLAACWNLENGVHDEGAMLIGRWFGLNDTDFKEKFSSIKMNLSMTKAEKRAVLNRGDLNLYMESLSAATRRINKKCNDILEGNHGSLSTSHMKNTVDSINTSVKNNNYFNELAPAFGLLAVIFLAIKAILMKHEKRSLNLSVYTTDKTGKMEYPLPSTEEDSLKKSLNVLSASPKNAPGEGNTNFTPSEKEFFLRG